jgi:hypothetical protein
MKNTTKQKLQILLLSLISAVILHFFNGWVAIKFVSEKLIPTMVYDFISILIVMSIATVIAENYIIKKSVYHFFTVLSYAFIGTMAITIFLLKIAVNFPFLIKNILIIGVLYIVFVIYSSIMMQKDGSLI